MAADAVAAAPAAASGWRTAMAGKVIRPDRRRVERRPDRLASLGDAVDDGGRGERRIHCWDLEPECTEERRRQCAAHFVRRSCWDLWAAEYFPPGRKPCCHSYLDCSDCPVAAAKFRGPVSIYVAIPSPRQGGPTAASAATRPATYCPFLYSVREGMSGRTEEEARLVFKCQRRRAVQLHGTYVSEVCGTPEHRECTFFEAP